MDTQKKDPIVVLLIVLAILMILFACLSPVLFTLPATNPLLDFRDKGQIGDTIGGLMNPFIALSGVFGTFLAFYMQLKANKMQLEIFNKNQQEQIKLLKNQNFQKLVDVINQRIISFTYTATEPHDNSQYFSYQALDKVVDFFHQTMNTFCKETLSELILYKPEIVEEKELFDLYFNAVLGSYYHKNMHLENWINEIKELNSYELRYGYLHTFIPGGIIGKPINNQQYMDQATKYFYHEALVTNREAHYAETYHKANLKFGGFMDGYFKSFSYLIHTFANESDYIKILTHTLSTQELTLIFYHIAARKSDLIFNEKIKNSHLLETLRSSASLFPGSPKAEELSKEIHMILSGHTET